MKLRKQDQEFRNPRIFYADPKNQSTTGAPARRPRAHRNLTEHIPVRFERTTIDAIRKFSDDDGLTVSAWIRLVVRREIERRSKEKIDG